MIIFVEGAQGVGKTTLINSCKYKHRRFPFNEYLEQFKLKSTDNLNGFQLGKDLGMLFALQFVKENIIFDRGPLSTVFYSLKEYRFGEETNNIVFNFLKEISKYQKISFIWIKKVNSKSKIKRDHNDGFDYLDDENDSNKNKLFEIIKMFANYTNINIKVFENDFSKKLKSNIHNFNNLLEETINEHDRN